MCIVGLKRSGNHAVINWIGQQISGEKVYFLNSCRPFENPYETKHSQDSAETIIFKNYRLDRERQRFEDKDCLLYSYEDRSLEDVYSDCALNNHDAWIGQSVKRYDILLLRDPFNLFASRLQRDLRQGKSASTLYDRYVRLKSLWIEYAREFVGASQYLRDNKTVINFNSWTRDAGYRRRLARQLGLVFTDVGFNEVVGVGGGSSFEGRSFDGVAQTMDVTKRWRRFASHPLYRRLLSDDVLIDLSLEIFGPIPGTEDWMSTSP
jgi:hypothetical protein